MFARTVHAPGATWGIIVDGALVHTGAAGVRDVASQAPVDADTVFRIASMTKSFTAMAILKLRDEGKLSLDDPAERYVPELKTLHYPTSDSPRITVRHLLTHSEGFPEDNPWGDQQLAVTDAEMNALMRAGIPFSTAPGTAYEYSNYGFAILGRIVANVSGMPYTRYLTERVPDLGVADLPFLFQDQGSARAAMDGRFGHVLSERIEAGMDFRILGPLEVSDGGRHVPLGGAKPRALLAVLLQKTGAQRPVIILDEALFLDRSFEVILDPGQIRGFRDVLEDPALPASARRIAGAWVREIDALVPAGDVELKDKVAALEREATTTAGH